MWIGQFTEAKCPNEWSKAALGKKTVLLVVVVLAVVNLTSCLVSDFHSVVGCHGMLFIL